MNSISMFRDQLTEDRIRNVNRLHRKQKIYFPEYMYAFGKIEGPFTLEVLKMSAIPVRGYIPEPCRVAADKHRRLGRVLEQKPVIDAVH